MSKRNQIQLYPLVEEKEMWNELTAEAEKLSMTLSQYAFRAIRHHWYKTHPEAFESLGITVKGQHYQGHFYKEGTQDGLEQ